MKVKLLMQEIDAVVKEFIDNFSFLLKYRELFKGGGIEFAGLKKYIPGEDDASRIDWKASLRTGKMFVKQYEEERDLDVFILMDASASMLFGTQDWLKYEYGSIISGALFNAAVQIGDSVGFAMFSDEIFNFLKPSQERSHYYQVLEFLVDRENYGGDKNLSDALKFVLNNIDEKTVLFFISDFIGVGEEWSDSLQMVRGKLDDVYGIAVRDIRDEKLPKGVGYVRFRNPYTGEVQVVEIDAVREEFERKAREQMEKVHGAFKKSDAGFIKVFTHEPFVKPLMKELELRRTIA